MRCLAVCGYLLLAVNGLTLSAAAGEREGGLPRVFAVSPQGAALRSVGAGAPLVAGGHGLSGAALPKLLEELPADRVAADRARLFYFQ